ncbi:cytochrome bd-type quinol oxidase subunit 2 [Xanthomonas translucens]
MDPGILTSMLTTVAFQLPILIVLVVGLALVAARRRARARTLALWGLSLLLFGGVCGMLTSLLPMWAAWHQASLQNYSVLLGVVYSLLTLLHAVAMLLVVLALRLALPRNPPAP